MELLCFFNTFYPNLEGLKGVDPQLCLLLLGWALWPSGFRCSCVTPPFGASCCVVFSLSPTYLALSFFFFFLGGSLNSTHNLPEALPVADSPVFLMSAFPSASALGPCTVYSRFPLPSLPFKGRFPYLFILLYNIVLVLPYIDLHLPWVYMCSPSWTPLPPPSTSHPSGSSQCTSPEHPVSCIEPGLAVCFTYDNLHVSMPFSHIILPSPSPTESKRVKWVRKKNQYSILTHIYGI